MYDTIAIVTGASSGLGLALAKALNHENTQLITVSRQTPILNKAEKTWTHYHADLSDVHQVNQLCEQLVPHLRLPAKRYLLINNAGTLGPIAQYHGIRPTLAHEIAQTFQLNIASIINLCSTFLQHCQAHIPAKIQIINISSGAARQAYAGWGVYCATKAALDRYSEVAQLEAPFAQIVSLAPGVIDTPMQTRIRNTQEADFPSRQRFQTLHEQGTLAQADKVAQKILQYSLRPDFGQNTLSDLRLL